MPYSARALEDCPLGRFLAAANECQLMSRERLRHVAVAGVESDLVDARVAARDPAPPVDRPVAHYRMPVIPSGGMVSPSAHCEASTQ